MDGSDARPRDNGITRNRAQTETARPYTTWSNAISSACDRSQTPGLDDLWRKVQKMGCTQIGERMGRGEVGIGSIGLLKVSMDYICYNRVAGSTVNMQALTCRVVDIPSARGGAHHWGPFMFHDSGRFPAVHTILRQRRNWPWGTHGGRPVLQVLRPTVMRPFKLDVEHAAQGHAEVRIGVTTCHQGNPSMPDAAR